MLKFLLHFRAYFKQKELIRAIQLLDLETAEQLLANGVPAFKILGTSPLDAAILTEKIEFVALLLKYNAPINERGKNGTPPLERAVDIQSKPIVELLLQKGALPNKFKRKYPLVNLATVRAYEVNVFYKPDGIEILKLLLAKGANVNLQTQLAAYPITKAALEQRVDLMRILLQYGAKIYHIWEYPIYKYSPLVLKFAIDYSIQCGINIPQDAMDIWLSKAFDDFRISTNYFLMSRNRKSNGVGIKYFLYDKVYYSEETPELLPQKNQADFHQIQDELVIFLSTGAALLVSIFWDDNGFVSIIQSTQHEDELLTNYEHKHELSDGKISRVSWLYPNGTADMLQASQYLLGFCIFFEYGEKIAIVSGDIEYVTSPEQAQLRLTYSSSLLLVIYDFKNFTNLPYEWY